MRLIAVIVLGIAAQGCGALPAPTVPRGSQQEDPIEIDPETPPTAPDVAPLPNLYGYQTLPVRGYVQSFDTVFVEGGRAPVATDADGAGNFCVDVPLHPGQRHELDVFVQDDHGQTSDPTRVTVQHDPSLAQYEIPSQPLVSVAHGLSVLSDELPKEGALSNTTDHDPTTTVLVMASRLWIDLGASFDIESIELEFPDEVGVGNDEFATEYQLLATDVTSPIVPPDIYEGWTLLYDVYPGSFVDAGDGGIDTFDLPTPLRTRYIALNLIENNKIDWLSTEDIRVAEIRVEGRSIDKLPAEPLTPTCVNGRIP